MKLKFLLLLVFITNICAAQNCLQMHGVINKNGVSVDKNYYLFEWEKVNVTFLNSNNQRVFVKGVIEKINDTFLVVNNQKIIYDSILILAFNKWNNESRVQKNAAALMILPVGLLSAAAILRSEEGDNATYGYNKIRMSEIVFEVGRYITGGYLPMFVIGAVGFIKAKTKFFMFDKYDQRVFSLQVVHQPATSVK